MHNEILQPVMPPTNHPAPAFKAKTTHGENSRSDYQGKWLVLFAHTPDFTPVCTSAKYAEQFTEVNM